MRVKLALRKEETRSGYLLIAPVFLHFGVFVVFPVLYALYLSFHKWNMLSPTMEYVGLRNYENLLNDMGFLQSLTNTVVYTAAVIGTVAVLSLLLALAFDWRLRASNFFRVMFFAPSVTSVIVLAVLWTWMFEPNFGVINQLAGFVHLPEPYWLSSTDTALPSVIITSVWRQVGYFAVIFLAGLQGIDEVYYEAAKVDGANALRRFRHVTLPMLMPTIFYVVVMLMVSSFQVFGLIYGMTGGGPVNSTSVIVYYLYREAFIYFRMGSASAMAYVLFAIIFTLTLIQSRFLGRRIDV